MTMKKTLMLIVLAAALYFSPGAGAQAGSYFFDTPVAGLTGHVSAFLFYGPPGFGEDPEHDSKENHYLLLLEKPIAVAPKKGDTSNEAVSNVRLIQIRSKNNDLSRFSEKKVMVSGKLYTAAAGGNITDVVMELAGIEQVNEK